MADLIVLAGLIELVALEINLLVVVDVSSVFQTELAATREDERQVGITMAVAKRHAASPQGHSGVQERPLRVLDFRKSSDKVGELLNVEHVTLGQVSHQLGIAVVMRKRVAVLIHANLRNGRALAFDAVAKGGYTCHVRLKGE